MTTSNLSAAADYIGEGLDILPLTPLSKIPLKGTRGVKDASDTIDAWEQDNNYNIGMACGASGIVVVDFDFRNGAPPVDSLFDDDDLRDVVIVDTPSGGVHLWFKQPDTIIGCPKSSITGIDIKGDGGYVVVPPSKVNGKHYAFRSDHELNEIPLSNLAVLPQHIIDILIPAKQEWGRTDSTPIPVEAEEIRARLACIPPLGTYDEWLEVLMAVHSAYPDEVGVALCEEWSPGKKGEIAKKFESFRKGGRGIGTLVYLSNKHGYTPPVNQDVRAKFAGVRRWIDSTECVEFLKQNKFHRTAEAVHILRFLVDLAVERGSARLSLSCHKLAKLINLSAMTVCRRLNKMNEQGIVRVEAGERGQTVDLSPLLDEPSVTVYQNGDTVTLGSSSFELAHGTDDAFSVYPYGLAMKRNQANLDPGEKRSLVLMTSLGATGRELWRHLVEGGSIKEIASASGYTVSCVRASIKKFLSCGLLDVDDSEKELAYVLKENAEEMLDDIRPHMVSFHVNQMRIGKTANNDANFAQRKLMIEGKGMDPRTKAWWTKRRDDADALYALVRDQLLSMDYDIGIKVGKARPPKNRRRMDRLEEWREWGRDWFYEWRALGSPAIDEAVRLMTIVRAKDAPADVYAMVGKEVQERFELMLELSRKRVEYERGWREIEQEDLLDTDMQQNMQMEIFA